MACFVEIDRCNHLTSLPLTSLSACPCRPSSNNALIFTQKLSTKLNVRIVFNRPKFTPRVRQTGINTNRRLISAVARAEPDRLDDGNLKEVIIRLLIYFSGKLCTCIHIYACKMFYLWPRKFRRFNFQWDIDF